MSIHLDTIKLNDRNPRRIGENQFHRLCDSIKRDPEFMRLRPIVVDGDGVIIGGNQRYRACMALGMTEVPEDWVVRAPDLTPEQRKRFVVMDNAPEGMVGEWDWGILGADWEIPELEELGLDVSDLSDRNASDLGGLKSQFHIDVVDHSADKDTRGSRIGLSGERKTMIVSVGMLSEVVPRDMVERLSAVIKQRWEDLPITRFVEWCLHDSSLADK